MRSAQVYVKDELAGILKELAGGKHVFRYLDTYEGAPVSLTRPLAQQEYSFNGFPAFFEGLLPEGDMLEGLLRQCKIDRTDLFAQLISVGKEIIGAVTVMEENT